MACGAWHRTEAEVVVATALRTAHVISAAPGTSRVEANERNDLLVEGLGES